MFLNRLGTLSVSAKSKAAKSQANAAPGIGTCWLGNAPVFAFGDGALLIGGKRYQPHAGGILSLVLGPDGQSVLTSGEDGCVQSTDSDGVSNIVFQNKGAWLDGLVVHAASNKVAVMAGRDVLLVDLSNVDAPALSFKSQRAPNSIAFSGDGALLAAGHSAGVSLFKASEPQSVWLEFPCSGGPVSVALDPSGGFLFAGLSEPALAGWRLADGQGFRMGGYLGKPRQLVWSEAGKALLTSGGPALLVWPMVGKDGQSLTGPMGQAAGVYRPRLGLVTGVATYGDVGVAGWSDGGVDLINLVDGTSRHLGGPRPPKTLHNDPRALTKAIVSVSFRGDGKQVSWIGETGAYETAAVQ
jgi:WD40 repeat protein